LTDTRTAILCTKILSTGQTKSSLPIFATISPFYLLPFSFANMTEPSSIARHIQELETYLTNLVEALQRGELPVNLRRVTQVFDQILSEDLPRLDLPPKKLIDIYNDVPSVLAAYTIEANITPASFFASDPTQAIFGRESRGNYWILPIKTAPEYAWLLPNPNRRITLGRLQSLPLAFDFDHANTMVELSSIGLTTLTLIKALPTQPPTWQVMQRGRLGNMRPTEQPPDHGFLEPTLPIEVRQLSRDLEKLKKSLGGTDNQIDSKLIALQKKLHSIDHQGSTALERLQTQYDAQLADQSAIITKIAQKLTDLRSGPPPGQSSGSLSGKMPDQLAAIPHDRPYTYDLGGGIKLEMLFIPAGKFAMGAPIQEDGSSIAEKPQHLVTVPSFYLSKYLITQEQYAVIMGKNPAYRPGTKLPVEQVSWHDAREFCSRLSTRTGHAYRLPSEAEWEYACRAGTNTAFYSGNQIENHLANYRSRSSKIDQSQASVANRSKQSKNLAETLSEKTTPVGKFPPNGFGLYDMHGNVWEWCQDTWHENYTGAPTDGSAWVSESDKRILRGGSWDNYARSCRSALRFKWAAGNSNYYIGFRVACEYEL
jgi:formylglycine-generating enzyme required for sulfatase activity